MPVASSDTPLYNSRIFDCYLKLLKKRYPYVEIGELLHYAGMNEGEIADLGHWFTQRQVNLFHEKLVHLSGNPAIAREAGRYAASSESLGFLREFLLGLIGPEHVFTIINRVSLNFTRSSRCASRMLGPNEMEITVTFEEGVVESPCQCENRIGYFEAVFLLFNREFPEIEHDECVFKGGKLCRYRIKWRPSRASRLAVGERFSICLLLISAGLVASSTGNFYLLLLFLLALPLHLVLSFVAKKSERETLLASLSSMRNSSERLLSQVQVNYDTALMVNEIGKVIARKTDLPDILSSVNQLLLKRLKYGRGAIYLADQDFRVLELKSCFGVTEEQKLALVRRVHSLNDPSGKGPLVRCFLEQSPILAKTLSDAEALWHPDNHALLADLGVRSFICAPIVCEGEALGVIAVDDPKREGALLESDLNLIQGVAPVIGIAVKNAMRLANERELSEELRKASEELEKRVQERTAELCQAQEELELLYDSVTHDLRTPLRVIYGYGEMLLERHSGQLDESGKEYLGAMIAGGEQMEATLDRMLDYSGVRSFDLVLQPVDLSELATRILIDLRITDPKRRVAMTVQPGVVVTGDAVLLKSVMENLLGNAWKYSAGKGESSISFGIHEGVCYVSDNGAGFDMAHSERLFKPFQRLHDRDSFAGHGLGLAMVNRMLERMGGRIWGDSTPGEGATFYFTLSGNPIPAEIPTFRPWANSSLPSTTS